MQWKHPGSSPPKKFKRVPSAGKMMASIFCDSQGIIMIDYLEQGRTINGTLYADELRRLCQEIASKRGANWLNAFWSCTTMRQLTYSKLRWLLQLTAALNSYPSPPYYPDLAPSDFYLFPKLKTKLRGRRFGSNEGVMEIVNEFF
jgi:histone-lysine N-methyltransferase SETMAR